MLLSILLFNVYRNSYILIKKNAFENAIWEMVVIVFQPQCVKNTLKNLVA